MIFFCQQDVQDEYIGNTFENSIGVLYPNV